LGAYDGKPARTVPIVQRTLTPREGETIVRTITGAPDPSRSRQRQLSGAWDPLVGYKVLVTGSDWFGSVRIVRGEQPEGVGWVVTLTVDDVAQDVVFASKELATLEPLKQ
jgi:hypothetical protein